MTEKSSTEILSELFGDFNSKLPEEINECDDASDSSSSSSAHKKKKKSKKSKKKHKSKKRKKKRSRSSSPSDQIRKKHKKAKLLEVPEKRVSEALENLLKDVKIRPEILIRKNPPQSRVEDSPPTFEPEEPYVPPVIAVKKEKVDNNDVTKNDIPLPESADKSGE